MQRFPKHVHRHYMIMLSPIGGHRVDNVYRAPVEKAPGKQKKQLDRVGLFANEYISRSSAIQLFSSLRLPIIAFSYGDLWVLFFRSWRVSKRLVLQRFPYLFRNMKVQFK